jgi:hypothetical protein
VVGRPPYYIVEPISEHGKKLTSDVVIKARKSEINDVRVQRIAHRLSEMVDEQ